MNISYDISMSTSDMFEQCKIYAMESKEAAKGFSNTFQFNYNNCSDNDKSMTKVTNCKKILNKLINMINAIQDKENYIINQMEEKILRKKNKIGYLKLNYKNLLSEIKVNRDLFEIQKMQNTKKHQNINKQLCDEYNLIIKVNL